ncbi:MAG: 4-carboxymuconolactone decarboxylase [Pseudomonas sp.]|nr:4-carboxymuconolactone decarboxylase [Pseudomonas sp.]
MPVEIRVAQPENAPEILAIYAPVTARDRCLVTVCTVVATAQIAQLPFYLNRAMDNGITNTQIAEIMTQLAFYSGWSSVYSALPVVKDVLEKRPD